MMSIGYKKTSLTGEMLGHWRHGTYGGNGIEQCHPFLRQSNWELVH